MKKIMYGILGVLLLFVSCNSEENSLRSPVVAEAGNVSFAINLPVGDPVTYAEIQTAKEKEIQRLDIYQFGIGDDGVLEAVYPNATLTSSSTGYTTNISVEDKGDKQFFFVANNLGVNTGGVPTIQNLAVGSVKAAAFKKKLTKKLSETKTLATPLLMTGAIASLTIDGNNTTPQQSVELERVMSRLDVQNFEPLLTITRVRLERTLNQSYLMHQTSSSQKPVGSAFVTLPEVTLPTTPTAVGSNAPVEFEKVTASGGFGAYDFYKHVYYLMVSDEVTDEAKAPLFIVEGILFKGDADRETKVVYSKPLKVEGESNFLGFKRNTRYTLVIEKAIKGELTASLQVDKWNEEILEVPIAPKKPKVTGSYRLFYNNEASLNLAKGVLTIRNDHTGTIILNVYANTEWEVLPEGATTAPADGQMADWIISKPANTFDFNTYPQNVVKRGLEVTCTANTTGVDREINLLLRSKVDNNKQYTLTVKQLKS